MSDLTFRERVAKRLNVNRLSRMHQHYLAIESEVCPKGKREREECTFFKRTFVTYYRKTRVLVRIRLALYVFLYASVAVNILKTTPILSFLVSFIELGSALFGTTLLFLFVLFVSMKINLHLELMNESLTHLIAIYHHNPKRNAHAVLKKIYRTL
jgi:hypothetical protein